MNKLLIISATVLASAFGLAGCNNSSGLASVTSAICADAAVVQSSTLELNKSQKLALNGIIASCATTAGGTVSSPLACAAGGVTAGSGLGAAEVTRAGLTGSPR